MTQRLAEIDFVELILGEGFSDMKSHAGTGASRFGVPEQVAAECSALFAQLKANVERDGELEFAHLSDGQMYRVTTMRSISNVLVFFLRRMRGEIRAVSSIPFPRPFLDSFMHERSKGLYVVTGDMASGKTTSVASLLTGRLMEHGDTALAFEDPPENLLDGLHGDGRCIQVPIIRRNGTYAEHIERAMRSAVSTVMIGEIRSGDVALEAIRLSLTMRVITTIHGKGPVDAIRRLTDFAGDTRDSDKTAKMLASGLSAVLHQELHRINAPNGAVLPGGRMGFKSLVIEGQSEVAMRAKLRESNFGALEQDVDAQTKTSLWNKQ
ncbi:ATPase, T2SS/T4P/T4SS family [Xanthomonas euvesicatoria]